MQTAEHHREQFELAYATAWAKDRDGGETPEQLAAEIKAWRVGDTYEAEFIRLRFGWEGYQWARAGQCLAQIEEPAQPVAEICSASHDDAQFGERAIKLLRDISGFEYGTPLYAGAAPAAVARWGCEDRSAWFALAMGAAASLEDAANCLRDKDAQKAAMGAATHVRESCNKLWWSVPALEAPAAPAEVEKLDAAAMPAQLSAIAAQAALDAKERHSYLPNTSAEAATWRPHFWVIQAMRAAIKFDRALNRAAAHQAPAAPSIPQWIDDPHDIEQGQMLNPAWVQAQAAPAAPAVDAWLQPDDMAALQRFHETAEDDESYDIGKEAVARLCAFGCLQSHSFGRYSTTDFGDYLLDTWAGARTLPFTTAVEREALAAHAAAKGEHDE